MDKKADSNPNASPTLDLQIAEYEALMNRNTYLVTLQFSLWPILLVFLTLVAQIWNLLPPLPLTKHFDEPHRLLIWATIFALQLIGAAWIQLVWEQLSNISYIERYIRGYIAQGIHEWRFWQYETHLAQGRGLRFIGDYWLTVSASLLIPLTALLVYPFSKPDYYGLGIDLLACCFLVIKTIEAMRLRYSLAAYLLKLPNGTRTTGNPGATSAALKTGQPKGSPRGPV
jgi:hypothetical protein